MRTIATLAAAACLTACGATPPHEKFIAEMDSRPEEARLEDWENTRALMVREAPKVGELAPDFTLDSRQRQTVSLSDFRGDKPVVLIFASFT